MISKECQPIKAGGYGICALLLLVVAPSFGGTRVTVSDAAHLQRLFASPVEGLTVDLKPGVYHLTPSAIIDSTCGNCEIAATPVEATVGLHIRGKQIRIIGPKDKSAIIHTHAGYGLLFEQCSDGVLENVTITGVEQDKCFRALVECLCYRGSRSVVLWWNNVSLFKYN